MKKLCAASLLSIGLCVSQAGSAWASTQTHFSPPVSSAEVGVSPQLHPIAWIIIGELTVEYLKRAIDKAWELWEENSTEGKQDVCNFYADYRYDIYRGYMDVNSDEKDEFWELGKEIYKSGVCKYLFDDEGNDVDGGGSLLW